MDQTELILTRIFTECHILCPKSSTGNFHISDIFNHTYLAITKALIKIVFQEILDTYSKPAVTQNILLSLYFFSRVFNQNLFNYIIGL